MPASSKSFKINFTLDEEDSRFFRNLYRQAKRHASGTDETKIESEVKELIEEVRKSPKVPNFVDEAVRTLEDLMQMIDDEDYALPKNVRKRAFAALAYFANPADLIPDNIPGLGFMDDAIIIKFVEDEFKHELWAYRKFRTFRDGAEQRPWTRTAKERLPKRLEDYRKSLRAKVREKHEKEAARVSKAKASRRGARGW